ncbi:hypothetical protein H5410_064467 [Solanum commersonii]|uniref:Uncharacterized protein n=1 Tax=Solanum commersonii TaxID=4109 RepID=A0A9J5VZA0_SOLCO|nr:hypothetical protein H5410_064467 [Solanum commersonii]
MLPEAPGSWNRRALILGWAYYLDAFSSYPLRTWLPAFTVGMITGTLEVRPSRSLSLLGKVLSTLTPTPDMDRTCLTMFEPSSRIRA